MAGPTTYSINGEQYVAVMAGYGGAPTCCYPGDAAMNNYQKYGRILAFKLGGNNTPTPLKRIELEIPEPPEMEINKSLIDEGAMHHKECCFTCHGGFAENHMSLHPDLSKMQK